MFAALQNLGSTHQHGDMSIMPTSMHFAGYLAFMLPFHSFLKQATPRFRHLETLKLKNAPMQNISSILSVYSDNFYIKI